MTDSVELIDALDRRVARRDHRREFFKAAFGMGAFAIGGAAALNFSTKASAQTSTITDADILNFALNLEYLEAQFYLYAANGTGLAANLLTGTGTQGAVITGTGANMARAVNFTDPAVRAYAREIAADELAHVTFLRSSGALGSSAVAQPAINISGALDGPFTAAARAAGVIPAGNTTTPFDPYADDNSFLLGAYIFEDVGVTAYKGASPLVTNKTFLQAAAGILAVEAYHAAIVRTTLYAKGVDVPALRTNADLISNARDSLDGATRDLDQGISPTTVNGALVSNIVPLDSNGLAFSRTPSQVLNIVYLNAAAATMGGFFPNGLNGNLRASVAAS
ncbi:ferritin-like domain-containing protein [Sphingomonas mollis]|uniref:Ferritin-like domain-containing protein n=1 Tax=Sphingomonas mollis TaxID=2795726 RepID=A0ABS0XS50_9SPHN|nr:ferritin-like domain-containing protein [Sphingomonas sp. BT553]MBJ6122852.1 ferritin-like domain-containing protein [Sphingomonas sp. BT553]